MTADSPSVLQRMATVPAPVAAEVPLTASRAVKLALTRSAEASIGLVLTVDHITEEKQDFDQFLASLDDNQVMLYLDRGDHVGLLAMDREMSAAIVEMRTTTRVYAMAAPDRRPTGADIALAIPMFAEWIMELDNTTAGTSLDGWTDGIKIGARAASARAVGLALPENTFRHMVVQVDLGAGERKGILRLALPTADAPSKAVDAVAPTLDWAQEMSDTVMESPATLDAILHRGKVPLSMIASLAVGQVLPLTGCQVSSVKLEATDGTFVARGRIGQMGGNIAVRIETPPETPMTALDGAEPMPTDFADPVAGMTLPDAGDPADLALGEMPAADLPMGDLPDMPMGDLPDLQDEVGSAEGAALPDLPAMDAAPMGEFDAGELPMDDFPAMDFDPDAFPDEGGS